MHFVGGGLVECLFPIVGALVAVEAIARNNQVAVTKSYKKSLTLNHRGITKMANRNTRRARKLARKARAAEKRLKKQKRSGAA